MTRASVRPAARQRASVPGPLAAARVLRALWQFGAAGEDRAVSVARVVAATGLTRAEVLAWGAGSATPTQLVRESRGANGEPALYLAGARDVEWAALGLKRRAKHELALADQLIAAERRADDLLMGGGASTQVMPDEPSASPPSRNQLARASRPAGRSIPAGPRPQREP